MAQAAAHLDTEPCTTVSVAHSLGSVTPTRRQMEDELTEHHIDRETIENAVLVMSELLANAVEHGRANDAGEVEVSWCVHDDLLRISVTDGGDVKHLRAVEPDPESLRGRGLYIVDYVCDRWSTDNENGTRVTAEVALIFVE